MAVGLHGGTLIAMASAAPQARGLATGHAIDPGPAAVASSVPVTVSFVKNARPDLASRRPGSVGAKPIDIKSHTEDTIMTQP